eukprot:Skav232841  [mRNA]  locus=scaffold1834:299625:311815:- [translate_table: standard]
MNIGLAVEHSIQLPFLFNDDCLAADSTEIDLGEVSGIFEDEISPPSAPEVQTPSEPSQGVPTLADVKSLMKRRNRTRKQQLRQRHLDQCLLRWGFKGLDASISLQSGEEIYPIHAVAMSGKPGLLRMMLNQGVDPEQKTSHGRTALWMAKWQANQKKGDDGILQVIELLHEPQRTLSMRHFVTTSSDRLTTSTAGTSLGTITETSTETDDTETVTDASFEASMEAPRAVIVHGQSCVVEL